MSEFSSQITDTDVKEICKSYGLTNIVKLHRCFKDPVNPICLNLTNKPNTFLKTSTA